jgi:hypothetical protein
MGWQDKIKLKTTKTVFISFHNSDYIMDLSTRLPSVEVTEQLPSGCVNKIVDDYGLN